MIFKSTKKEIITDSDSIAGLSEFVIIVLFVVTAHASLCLSAPPLSLCGELTRMADVSDSRRGAGLEVFFGCERCGIGHSGTGHLSH